MQAFGTIFKTELKLSIRGMDMIIFAIGMPVAIILILGMLYGAKPAFEGAEYTFVSQSFGAVASIAIAAGGVMGLPLVIADYRHKKILKRLKVTPVRPALILAVQVAIYALYSIVSLILVYVTAAVFFDYRFSGSPGLFLGAYFLVMASMFSIGLLVGGVSPNSKIAGVLASVLYFPMVLFSGATLPYEVMPPALQKLSDFLPLTQAIKLLKSTSTGLPISGVRLPILVMSVTALVCTLVSIRFFKWE